MKLLILESSSTGRVESFLHLHWSRHLARVFDFDGEAERCWFDPCRSDQVFLELVSGFLRNRIENFGFAFGKGFVEDVANVVQL